MISASSYSSTAPKPLHVGHAPRGLLNEKSCGVGVGARVPSYGHSKRSVYMSRDTGVASSPCVPDPARPAAMGDASSTTASPSPSRNAVPTASARRLPALGSHREAVDDDEQLRGLRDVGAGRQLVEMHERPLDHDAHESLRAEILDDDRRA